MTDTVYQSPLVVWLVLSYSRHIAKEGVYVSTGRVVSTTRGIAQPR